MNHVPGHVERYHAVGHIQKDGIQFCALVFHCGKRRMERARHFVKRARQDTDFVGGFHRQGLSEFPGGDFLRPGG